MKTNLPLITLAALLTAAPLFAADDEAGFVPLFNGTDLTGWKLRHPKGTASWSVKDGALVNDVSGGKHGTDLVTEKKFWNFTVRYEFMVPDNSNSGFYLRGRYEIQILDSWGVKEPKYGDCGGVYASCSEPKPDFPGRPPSVSASKPPGQWQSYDIVFHPPKNDAEGKVIRGSIPVLHNGVLVQDHVPIEVKATTTAKFQGVTPKGPLVLQDHGNPVRYRNIWIRPL